MSRVRKLFIATALIATGLAVAILLGHPIKVQQSFTAMAQNQLPQSAVPLSPLVPTPMPSAQPAIRLTPDVESAKVATVPDAPALLSPLSAFSTAPPSGPDFQFNQPTTPLVAPPAQRFDGYSPVAKLRDEAPRAIGNESRSPVTIRRAPPVDTQLTSAPVATSPTDPYRITPNWPTTLMPAPSPSLTSSTSNGNPITTNPTPATATAFAMGASPATDPRPPAPQAQFTEEPDDARTHIIADGDSLEKLAGLYLHDPQRGKEIYELNRGVLSDPNLLPIGAELKIPDRASPTSWARQSRLPGYQGDAAVREAAIGDLIPIRSMPNASISSSPPHAQLTRPIAAD